MSEVGALIVKFQAETAQFRSDMGKVKSTSTTSRIRLETPVMGSTTP